MLLLSSVFIPKTIIVRLLTYLNQGCNQVTAVDPDDPVTHWFKPGDLEDDPDLNSIATASTINQ